MSPPADGGATDAKADAKTIKDTGVEEEAPPVPPSGTVGKECSTTEDCQVPDTENLNMCSKGAFTVGDLYGTPVCVGPCEPNPNAQVVDDLLCDDKKGLCLAAGTSGNCFPVCQYDSTAITEGQGCTGSNKCAAAYTLTKTDGSGNAILGFCFASCLADADCKGTPGQKCQVESGICVKALTTYAKNVGEGCNGAAATDECNCATIGGTGASKDKGFCTHHCVTGAAGNTLCDSKKTGWKCTAGLNAKNTDGTTAFTGQPDGVIGSCRETCTADADCTALGTAVGAGTPKCIEFGEGKYCDVQ